MKNRPAITNLCLAAVFVIFASMPLVGIFKVSKEVSPLILLCIVLLTLAGATLVGAAIELRNYPSQYVPKGRYHIERITLFPQAKPLHYQLILRNEHYDEWKTRIFNIPIGLPQGHDGDDQIAEVVRIGGTPVVRIPKKYLQPVIVTAPATERHETSQTAVEQS